MCVYIIYMLVCNRKLSPIFSVAVENTNYILYYKSKKKKWQYFCIFNMIMTKCNKKE